MFVSTGTGEWRNLDKFDALSVEAHASKPNSWIVLGRREGSRGVPIGIFGDRWEAINYVELLLDDADLLAEVES